MAFLMEYLRHKIAERMQSNEDLDEFWHNRINRNKVVAKKWCAPAYRAVLSAQNATLAYSLVATKLFDLLNIYAALRHRVHTYNQPVKTYGSWKSEYALAKYRTNLVRAELRNCSELPLLGALTPAATRTAL